MSSFAVTERPLRGDSRLIEVVGELDLAVADQLRSTLDAIPADVSLVVIGLERCEFLDSTGLAVILAAHQELEKSGRRLVLSSPTRQVERILEITGLANDGFVLDGVEEALPD
jgi:anti-anti-sigma factor